MAVMHLRLEHPDTMVVPAKASASSPNAQAISTDTSIVVAQSSDEKGGQGSDADSPIETSSGGAQTDSPIETSSDGAQTCSSPKGTTEELHRIPSMNLATDPAVWVGDATVTPGVPYRRASDNSGGNNPFDASSDEDENKEATQKYVGDWGDMTGVEGELDQSLEAQGRRPISKGTNPFDFSFYDDKEKAAVAEGAACGRDGGVDKTHCGGVAAGDITRSQDAAATFSLDSQSSRLYEIFRAEQVVPTAAAAAAPSQTRVAAVATQETVWPTAVDSSVSPNVDQLLLPLGAPPVMQTTDLTRAESPSTSIGRSISPLNSTGLSSTTPANWSPLSVLPPSAATPATATLGMAKAPQDKCLPPTPLLAFGAEGTSSSPSPTPPANPFSIPLAKAPMVDLCPTLRETTDGASSPCAAQASDDLFSAFRNTTEVSTTPSTAKEQVELFSAFRDPTETPSTPPTKEQENLFYAFGDRSETLTPPPPTKEQTELRLAFGDNTADPPSPRPAEIPAGLHSASRDREDVTPPEDTLPSPLQPGREQWQQKPQVPPKPDFTQSLALLDGADSGQREEDFNPFGRPGSVVLSDAKVEELSPPGGTVRKLTPSSATEAHRFWFPLHAPI